jgi:hypothetical protein
MIASPRPVIDAGYINAAVGQIEIDPNTLGSNGCPLVLKMRRSSQSVKKRRQQ